jgi:nucleoside-diphosphate-sugar epimerase
MRILVTGGSGFIGTNYIDLLCKNGHWEFLNVSHQAPRNREQNKFWEECDLLDGPRLEKIIKDFHPTHVVHLAAKCGLAETRIGAYAANMEGVENLLSALEKCSSVERVVFTSTMLVCRVGYIPQHDTDYQPSTLYGQSKVRMEQIIRSRPTLAYTWVIVRPISIWGPWCGEPYKPFFQAIARGWYLHVGHGHYTKSLGYVGKTVHQMHKLLIAPAEKVSKKTMYLADHSPTDLHRLASEAARALGAKRIRHIPLAVAKVAAKVGDLARAVGVHSVPLTSFRLNNILTEYVFDLQPITEIAGSLPYDLKTGVERTVEWLWSVGAVPREISLWDRGLPGGEIERKRDPSG